LDIILYAEEAVFMESLKNRSFLTLLDFTPEEIKYYIDLAAKLKRDKKAGVEKQTMKGKNIALIFEKDSTRTRCAFEVGAADQGAHTTYLGPTGSQLNKKESVADTARVLGRMYDAIEYRGFDQETVELLAKYAGVPVWNGLTDYDHPTQVLANFLTIMEHTDKPLNKIKFAYIGSGKSNMSNAMMIGAVKMGMDFTLVGPKEFFPDADLIEKCEAVAKETGATITLTDDVKEGVLGIDVIYTGVWVTMGDPYEAWESRIKQFLPYQVNMEMIKASKNENVIFCHCLPAFHDTNTKVGKDIFERFGLDGIEVTNDVFESKCSTVFDEAENRLHTIKALMVATLGQE
jgi:ornithine carbamoyltransferase